jgi:hypothetical protein
MADKVPAAAPAAAPAALAAGNFSHYRAMHQLRKGGLHDHLGIPKDDTIPADKLEAASKSPNAHVAQMAKFHAQRGK